MLRWSFVSTAERRAFLLHSPGRLLVYAVALGLICSVEIVMWIHVRCDGPKEIGTELTLTSVLSAVRLCVCVFTFPRLLVLPLWPSCLAVLFLHTFHHPVLFICTIAGGIGKHSFSRLMKALHGKNSTNSSPPKNNNFKRPITPQSSDRAVALYSTQQ